MLIKKTIKTEASGLYDITAEVKAAVAGSGIKEGLCVVYCADADTALMLAPAGDAKAHEDILDDYNRIFPPRLDYGFDGCKYKAAAHAKTAVTGSSVDVIISGGEAVLDEAQGIFIAEFLKDKERAYFIKCLGE